MLLAQLEPILNWPVLRWQQLHPERAGSCQRFLGRRGHLFPAMEQIACNGASWFSCWLFWGCQLLCLSHCRGLRTIIGSHPLKAGSSSLPWGSPSSKWPYQRVGTAGVLASCSHSMLNEHRPPASVEVLRRALQHFHQQDTYTARKRASWIGPLVCPSHILYISYFL